MNCPACHTENASEALTCAKCGCSLPTPDDRQARRSESRRNGETVEAALPDSNSWAARWVYHMSLWSILPILGLVLGPAAVVSGCWAVRRVGDDFSATNRAKAAIILGAASTLTQWLGVALIYASWS